MTPICARVLSFPGLFHFQSFIRAALKWSKKMTANIPRQVFLFVVFYSDICFIRVDLFLLILFFISPADNIPDNFISFILPVLLLNILPGYHYFF